MPRARPFTDPGLHNLRATLTVRDMIRIIELFAGEKTMGKKIAFSGIQQR